MNNQLVGRLSFTLAILPAFAFAQAVPLTQDSYVATNPATASNYGSATTINVGGPGAADALVQFDLTALPAGTTATNIAKATLTLYLNKVAAAGAINISVANGAWTESAVDGLNAPTAAAAVASGVSVTATAAGSYVYVDATAAVQSWLTATANNGFIVTPNDTIVNVSFDSKESTTTSHPALLTITLQASGLTGATGATGPMGFTGATGPTGVTGAAWSYRRNRTFWCNRTFRSNRTFLSNRSERSNRDKRGQRSDRDQREQWRDRVNGNARDQRLQRSEWGDRPNGSNGTGGSFNLRR